jgi:hypothetical protein
MLVLLKCNAYAGAWLKKAKGSELNAQYEYKTLLNYYTKASDNTKYLSKAFILELYQVHYQYGINDKFTLVVEEKWYNYKNYLSAHRDASEEYNFYHQTELMFNNNYRKFENNPYETKLGLQTALWSNENSILSIKPGFELYNNKLDKAIEIVALYGYSFKLGKQYSYINLEIGIGKNVNKLFSSGLDMLTSKIDISLGIALTKKHTAIFQSFNHKNIGIFRNQNSHMGQFSWQYQYNKNISWQSGYSTNLTNRDKYINESVISGITIKF